jgi:molybdopterin/thiamine biosynthesis adenylyltransferase
MTPELTPHDRERYDRNIRLAQVGEAGQRRLLESAATVVGAGGLGSAAILYLAAAGVGRIRIIEPERLELSNLNRQIIHRAADIGRLKVESAAEAVRALAPDCIVEPVPGRATPATARDMLRGGGIVLDCTDNFPARLVVADACWAEGLTLVTAAVLRLEGQLMTVIPAERSPCYRCLMPEAPPPGSQPAAAQVGILGAVAGAMGTLQAIEAIKVLLGIGRNFAHRLLIYDGLEGTFRTVRRTRDPACPVCGAG